METFEVDSCIQRYHVFESTGTELNCVVEKGQTPRIVYEALSCPPKDSSAACALFLRRRVTIRHDQLRLVLFNTSSTAARTVTKNSVPGQAHVRAHHVHMCMCGWYAYVMFIISADLNLARI